MAQLELRDVYYRYKNSDKDALQNINCIFPKGCLSAVIGPSGSGKTTLLFIMAGLDYPTSGEVFMDDVPLKELDLDSYRREKVSMIFQGFQLFPLLTVLENAAFTMEVNGVSKKEANKKSIEILLLLLAPFNK